MLPTTPFWLDTAFIIIVLATIYLFFLANGKRNGLLGLLLAWSVLHSLLAWQGIYLDTKSLPPPFAIVLIGSTVLIAWGLLSAKGQEMIYHKNLVVSTALHTIRIPVEVTLLYLFVYKYVPELMTFEGRNFDIFSGITAPVMASLLAYRKVSNGVMIIWNIICLGLVLFILGNGILSTELPIQQFGFEQPNTAVLYFPYVLLPAVVVPIVIYSHLSDLMVYFRKAGK